MKNDVKTIKAMIYKHFSIELLELPNSKYCVHWETQGQTFNSVDITSLDLALEMFSDTLILCEGH